MGLQVISISLKESNHNSIKKLKCSIMKRVLFTIIAVITIISCSKEKDQIGLPYDNPIEFSYIDENGEDLLNSNHPNYINISSIKLFNVIDGVKKLIVIEGTDNNNGVNLNCNDNSNCTLSFRISEMTIIELGSQYSDTICLLNNRSVITYNGEVIWEAGVNPVEIPLAVIVK